MFRGEKAPTDKKRILSIFGKKEKGNTSPVEGGFEKVSGDKLETNVFSKQVGSPNLGVESVKSGDDKGEEVKGWYKPPEEGSTIRRHNSSIFIEHMGDEAGSDLGKLRQYGGHRRVNSEPVNKGSSGGLVRRGAIRVRQPTS
jgi:hypothetical protein